MPNHKFKNTLGTQDARYKKLIRENLSICLGAINNLKDGEYEACDH